MADLIRSLRATPRSVSGEDAQLIDCAVFVAAQRAERESASLLEQY